MIPVNIDAANAIDVGAFPVVGYTQTVDDAGTTYTVWHKFTATATGIVRWFGFGDLTVYKPTILVFLGPEGAPVQYIVSSAQNRYIQFPVTLGVTYYIQSTKNADVSPAVLTIDASYFSPAASVPMGSLAVNDDKSGFPLGLADVTDPTNVLYFVQDFPAGEQGQILDSGRLLVEDISGVSTDDVIVRLYDDQYNLLTSNVFPSSDGWQRTYIGTDINNDVFYLGWAADYDNFSGEPSYRIVTADGVVGVFVALEGSGLTGLGTSNDGSIVYYSGKNGPGNFPVKRWDQIGGVGLSDLAANIVGYKPSDILVLLDDTIVILYYNAITLDTYALRYSPAGAVLNTYNFGATIDPRIAHTVGHTAFWAMMHPTSGGLVTGVVEYSRIRASDGVVLEFVQGFIVEHGVYAGAPTATPPDFGVSQSCPFWETQTDFTPSTTGTLIVTKVTTPAGQPTSFTFTAGGGLSPTSFSLLDTESKQFDDLVPGNGYSIVETADPNYTIDYDVSNGSPIDNIFIAPGETVTVIVTNTRLPNKYSGIYKIVPNKTNDTLWTSFGPDETIDVKIPDPFIKTALIGS